MARPRSAATRCRRSDFRRRPGPWPLGHRPGEQTEHRLAGTDGYDEDAAHACGGDEELEVRRLQVEAGGQVRPRHRPLAVPQIQGRVVRVLADERDLLERLEPVPGPLPDDVLDPAVASQPEPAPIGAERRADQGRHVEDRLHVELLAHRAGDLAEGPPEPLALGLGSPPGVHLVGEGVDLDRHAAHLGRAMVRARPGVVLAAAQPLDHRRELDQRRHQHAGRRRRHEGEHGQDDQDETAEGQLRDDAQPAGVGLRGRQPHRAHAGQPDDQDREEHQDAEPAQEAARWPRRTHTGTLGRAPVPDAPAPGPPAASPKPSRVMVPHS